MLNVIFLELIKIFFKEMYCKLSLISCNCGYYKFINQHLILIEYNVENTRTMKQIFADYKNIWADAGIAYKISSALLVALKLHVKYPFNHLLCGRLKLIYFCHLLFEFYSIERITDVILKKTLVMKCMRFIIAIHIKVVDCPYIELCNCKLFCIVISTH